MAQGDSAGAAATLRETWRSDGFSADLEAQGRAAFAGLITPDDDAARMDARLYVDDDDAGLRAAQHLDATALAVAKARAAVINQADNAKALLDAVPEAARHDAGYMFSRIQVLRRQDKIAEAAQWLMAAPRDPAKAGNPDPWWVERRLISRKLLDLGDAKMAYDVANDAAPPVSDNFRAEQDFTAGWIALRFLREPGTAMAHFVRVADGATNPITWRARTIGKLVPPRPWGGIRTRVRSSKRPRIIRPPITASWRGRSLGSTKSHCVSCRIRGRPTAACSKLARAFAFSMPSTNRDLIAAWRPISATRRPDLGGLATLGRHRRAPQRRAGGALIGKTRSDAAIRSSAMRSRILACRTTSRSDPRSSPAWSMRSCAKRARSTRASSRAPMRSA